MFERFQEEIVLCTCTCTYKVLVSVVLFAVCNTKVHKLVYIIILCCVSNFPNVSLWISNQMHSISVQVFKVFVINFSIKILKYTSIVYPCCCAWWCFRVSVLQSWYVLDMYKCVDCSNFLWRLFSVKVVHCFCEKIFYRACAIFSILVFLCWFNIQKGTGHYLSKVLRF